jgi:hypothetical protein
VCELTAFAECHSFARQVGTKKHRSLPPQPCPAQSRVIDMSVHAILNDADIFTPHGAYRINCPVEMFRTAGLPRCFAGPGASAACIPRLCREYQAQDIGCRADERQIPNQPRGEADRPSGGLDGAHVLPATSPRFRCGARIPLFLAFACFPRRPMDGSSGTRGSAPAASDRRGLWLDGPRLSGTGPEA